MQEILLGLGGNGVHSGPPMGNGSFVGRGDLVDGVRFWGEVPTVGFINGTELVSAIGLAGGSTQHTNAGWLHFELDGKTLYVAKKTLRYSITWDQINARGAVYGTSTVDINGLTYKVRLLTGANVNPTSVTHGYDPAGTSASEWNRLIYAVHNGVHTDANNPTPPGHWPLYSDTDLVVHSTGGNGSRSWCQETTVDFTDRRVHRGFNGVSDFGFSTSSGRHVNYGWRPVLELIED